MRIVLTIIAIMINCALLIRCSDDRISNDFFQKGDFSNIEPIDSIYHQRFSNDLVRMGEQPIRNASGSTRIIRLTAFADKYNPYCVKVETNDSSAEVTIKIAGDEEIKRTYLDRFALSYSTSNSEFHSKIGRIENSLNRLKIFKRPTDPDSIALHGTVYILEFYNGKDYKSVNGQKEMSPPGFGEIVDELLSLIPPNIIPDYKKAKVLEDVRFSIFGRRGAQYDSLR
jgi:hypothetical protein